MKSKQTGKLKIGKLALVMILTVGVFAALFAYKKRTTIYNKVSSIATTVTETIVSEPSYTGFGVQLMATRYLPQATRLMNDFARDGYSAFVLSADLRGSPIYKVRIGPYAHRAEALAIKDKLKRRYARNRHVKRSIVIYRP